MTRDITLQPAEYNRWEEFIPDIQSSWDTPMSSFSDARDWVSYITDKAAGVWFITVDSEFAGCFVLLFSPTVENRYHSSTFLLNKFRGTEVNGRLKAAIVQAFKDTTNRNLVSFILVDNLRSIAAMNKAFPEIDGEEIEYTEQDGTTKKRVFFDLGQAENNKDARNEISYQQMIQWLRTNT